MLKYDEYILESKLVDFILESKLVYSRDFANLVKDIANKNDKIANELINLIDTDLDLSQNNISLSGDKNDSINFLPEKKIPENRRILIDDKRFYPLEKYKDLFDIKKKKFTKELPIRTTGIIRETKPHPTGKVMYGVPVVLAHFIADNGSECIVNELALENIPYVPKPGTMNVGRFVNRLLATAGVDFETKDIENFVNAFKAEYDIRKNDIFSDFALVSGELIRAYYNEGNYCKYGGGTLWNSCMRYPKCQGYLDIYVKNPDKVQLLVLMSEDKIKARALVWKLDPPEPKGFFGKLANRFNNAVHPDRFFMDRIYTIRDSDVNLFINYAKKNGWYYKSKQISDARYIVGEDVVKCTLNNWNFVNYPYMDTMHLLTDNGVLTNDYRVAEDSIVYYGLRRLDGSFDTNRGNKKKK